MRKFIVVILIALTVLQSSCFTKNAVTEDGHTLSTEINIEWSDSLKAADDYRLISGNSNYELYLNGATTNMIIKSNKTGESWYTFPEAENINPVTMSQLEIAYYNESSKISTLYSYSDSVILDQFQYAEIDQGVRIIYTLGKKQKLYLIPRVISKQRFEELILNGTDEISRDMLLTYYQIITLENLSEDERKKVLEKYPSAKNGDIYVLYEDLADFVMVQIEEIIIGSGYTTENLKEDNSAHDIQLSGDEQWFEIPMDFILNDNGLSVSIELNAIRGSSQKDKLVEINLLKYFGAANSSDEGYIFVPDGSGAIITLNDRSSGYSKYRQPVYGVDKTIIDRKNENSAEQIHLPVYGIKKNNQAFCAIIEEGDAYAYINAEVLGENNPYNTVYPSFIIQPFEVANLSIINNQGTNVYPPRIMSGIIKVDYSVLTGDEAGYVGMAKCYRRFLVERDEMPDCEIDSIPFFLNLNGAIAYRGSFMGVPVTEYQILTSYNQAATIIKELSKRNVDYLHVKYSACLNNGKSNGYFNKSVPVKNLGTIKELLALQDSLISNNGQLFMDADIQYVYKNSLLDGFNTYTHASKNLLKEVAATGPYNLSTNNYQKGSLGYIVSPSMYEKMLTTFLNDYSSMGLTSLALSNMGEDLNSDFSRSRYIDRQTSLTIITDSLRQVADLKIELTISGGNSYAVKYASNLLDVPLESSMFYIEGDSVPFYQIVYHGYISYAGTPLNLSEDIEMSVLKSIETGASPYFDWMYIENMALKEINVNAVSLNYKTWIDQAAEIYAKINGALSAVKDSQIEDHYKLDEGVYAVKYSNGVCIYVNYNEETYKNEQITIPSSGYLVIEGVR
jgi:hypothetical protein